MSVHVSCGLCKERNNYRQGDANRKQPRTKETTNKHTNIRWHNKLQSWPELLGHKGNKPVKMTYFLPPPPPDAMLMSGIQVIFGRLNIAWGEGGTKEMVY